MSLLELAITEAEKQQRNIWDQNVGAGTESERGKKGWGDLRVSRVRVGAKVMGAAKACLLQG